MKYCLLFFSILLLFGVLESNARNTQKDSTTILLGGQLHYGFILPHSREIIEVSKSNPWGISMELSRIRQTKKSWDACNCISQNGISFSYFNFDYPDVLGSSYNLSLFGEPILITGKVMVSIRGGAGISYITKVYDAEDNPTNLFFSNPLSGILTAQLNSRMLLSERWTAKLGISYNHISNGGSRQPNKGMNFPTLSVGIDYGWNPLPLNKREKIQPSKTRPVFYTGLFGNLQKVYDPLSENKRMPMIGLQVGSYKLFTLTNAAGVAMEGSYNFASAENNKVSFESYSPLTLSGLLKHHFIFGNFDFSQAIGFYLSKNHKQSELVFQRYALDYRLGKIILIGFSLKAHLHVAETMDIRLITLF